MRIVTYLDDHFCWAKLEGYWDSLCISLHMSQDTLWKWDITTDIVHEWTWTKSTLICGTMIDHQAIPCTFRNFRMEATGFWLGNPEIKVSLDAHPCLSEMLGWRTSIAVVARGLWTGNGLGCLVLSVPVNHPVPAKHQTCSWKSWRCGQKCSITRILEHLSTYEKAEPSCIKHLNACWDMLRLHDVNKTLRCIWRVNWQPRSLHSRTEPRALIRQVMTTQIGRSKPWYPDVTPSAMDNILRRNWLDGIFCHLLSLWPIHTHPMPMFPSLADNETSTTFGWVSVAWPAALLGGFHCAESRWMLGGTGVTHFVRSLKLEGRGYYIRPWDTWDTS